MTNSPIPSGAVMFNNPFLSDIKIRQTYYGATKEYYAHKAVLCIHSKWFQMAFAGNFKEASDRIIELHDDDPVYFEIVLKFCYTHEWESPPRGNLDFSDEFFENRFFAPIGVYALADKYDIPGMRVCATQAFPNPGQGLYDIDLYKKIVGAHYEQCVDRSCPMGCKIAALLIEHSRYHYDRNTRQAFLMSEDFENLAKRYQNLNTDLVFQCLKGDGRLF